MKIHHIAIIGLLLCSSTVTAQPSENEGSYELYGNLLYSYSNETWRGLDRYESFEWYIHSHRISLRPGIGYFLTRQIEIVAEPHYEYSFSSNNSLMYLSQGNYEWMVYSRWTHNVGISFGPSFHYWLNERAAIFLAAKGGVSWSYIGSNPGDPRIRSPWKKPEIRFPVVAIGSKIFANTNWAGTIQIEFSRTTNYSGYDDHTITVVAAGVGLAVFL